jgi:hypothetical protein
MAILKDRLPVLRRRTKMRLSDPISSVLKEKSHEIWSVTPDQSVYEAIERWQTREWEHCW